MRTTYLLLTTFVFVNTMAFAQNGRFSLGAELAFPGGDYGDNSGTGFGGSLRYEMPMGNNLGIMGTVGYISYGKKTNGFVDYTNSLVPIMAGAKYYFMEQQNGFYVDLQLGVSILSTKVESGSYSNTNSTSAFTWSPGIGYHLANLDFGLGYFGFSYSQDVIVNGVVINSQKYKGNWIGLRIAYVFGSK